MLEMTQPIQELLENLWLVEEREQPLELETPAQREALQALETEGMVEHSDSQVQLTEAGRQEARLAIRRHRLAERLLADVVQITPNSTHEAGCHLEHALYAGTEDRVCRLLGHPRQCPHGNPIPPGECCRQAERPLDPLVARLADMHAGESGEVTYLSTDDSVRLRELVALGVLPGVQIKLTQESPAFVFSIGESEFAVDREMAGAIFVRLHDAEEGAGLPGRGRGRQSPGGRGRGGGRNGLLSGLLPWWER